MRAFLPLCILFTACIVACTSKDQNTSSSATPPPRGEILSWGQERGPVKVTLDLQPGKPRLSDEPELTLTIRAEDGVHVKLPPFGESLGGFLIRDFREPLPRYEGGVQILQQVYRLEPVAVGEQIILPVAIHFEDQRPSGDGNSHKVITDPQTIEVHSMVAAEAPSLDQLRSATPPVEFPPTPLPLGWLWIPAAVIGLFVLALVLLRARQSDAVRKPQYTPSELAYRELRRLLQEDPLSRGDVKSYYVELTAIVRRFVERTTGIRAPEQTTREFLRAMQRDASIPSEQKTRLQAFLEAADLVKFAAQQPGSVELDSSMQRAREFVGLSTTPLEKEEAAA